jgi:phosphoribosyl-dephospho-CoA transferase
MHKENAMPVLKRTLLASLLVLLLSSLAWGEVPLPDALKALPRYPGSVVMQTMDMGGTVNAMFEVKGTLDEVLAFFNKELEGQGWTKTMEARQQDGAMVNYNKDSMSLAVGMSPEEEGLVHYTVILSTM